MRAAKGALASPYSNILFILLSCIRASPHHLPLKSHGPFLKLNDLE